MTTKTQLQQLTEFLLASLSPIVKANNIDAWQERGTLILSGEDLGANSYQVAKWKHSAVIAIEKFPHRKVNPYSLLAMVAAYLIDSGWSRDEPQLADPQIDIDEESADTTTVLIEVELLDDIELVPDVNGPVLFNGARYRVTQAPLYIAETVDTVVSVQGDA
ncbi:phage tail protein [Shewanella psychrotolerans]|uniref:phage tail protein n=1 Tax=Shewanella psychrotolerans TaxID=2864206 RepID=UPI001C65C90E|nr:phage tail protein [Shewanella psychrotolerans]QYK02439.1 phage tail protein [Shewanella psychrotolerans]